MPAHSTERYVVYSVEKENANDDKSSGSDRSCSITFRDTDYVHLNGDKLLNGNGLCHPLTPTTSTTSLDKWGPYWTRRERCCCFWNFLMTVALAVLITIVILVTKGVVDIRQGEKGSNGSIEKFSSADVTFKSFTCPTQGTPKKECTDEKCIDLSVKLLNNMNVSADPCEDFYEFACGSFVKQSRVTWTDPRLRVNPDVIVHRGFEDLLDRLSDIDRPTDSKDKRILNAIFKSCVDHKNTPIAKEFIRHLGGFGFGEEGTTKQWKLTELLAEITLKFGAAPFFELDVRRDGRVGLYNRFSDKDFDDRVKFGMFSNRYRFFKPSDFIYRDETKDEALLAYKEFIGDFVAYVTQINSTKLDDPRFVSMIDDIYHLNVYINRVLFTEDTTNLSDGISKCVGKMNLQELQHRFNYNISWKLFFTYLQREQALPQNYTICHVSLSNALQDVLSEFSEEAIQHYLIFYVLTQSDIFYVLPHETPMFFKGSAKTSAFRSEIFGSSAMQCAKQLYHYLPMSELIDRNVLQNYSDNMKKLFSELFSSLDKILRDLYWVPTKQKKHLLTVLNELTMQFDWMIQDSPQRYFLAVKDSYFDNVLTMISFNMKQILLGRRQRIFAKDDSSIFDVTDSVLNVPILVTQLPFIHDSDIISLWYGSVGIYLAQPMSELFDIDAWLKFLTDDKIDHSVALTIAHRVQCLVTGFNDYMLHTEGTDHYVRGDLTKSANFKDSIALRIAHNSYRKVSHKSTVKLLPSLSLTSDQLFYLAYTQTMCEKVNTKGTYQYYIDMDDSHHAPGKYRVIGTLSNFKPFADAFKCKPGSRMNPKTKCSLF